MPKSSFSSLPCSTLTRAKYACHPSDVSRSGSSQSSSSSTAAKSWMRQGCDDRKLRNESRSRCAAFQRALSRKAAHSSEERPCPTGCSSFSRSSSLAAVSLARATCRSLSIV
eukprot:952131-Prymnesium_polylepis.1